MRRIILIVLDSVGVGSLPDAAHFGEVNANTLGHIAATTKLHIPNLNRLGLANIIDIRENKAVTQPLAAWGKMASQSAGMDTTSGHWELSGLLLKKAMPTYPHGFPQKIIDAFSVATGRGVLGNYPASGLAIIDELGAEQIKTGKFIVYTSADSVFQIAANEQVIPLAELYQACEKARAILDGDNAVGRVIARPFIGKPGSFQRTSNRRDYSLLPPSGGLLENLVKNGQTTVAIGKIKDIFANQYINSAIEAHNNQQGVDGILLAMEQYGSGLIFANLVDFDMLYGHRNDVIGYACAIEKFDSELPQIINKLRLDDLLIITADHGNDPTTMGTDHTREYVPLLIYGEKVKPQFLGVRQTFADVGATCAAYLGCPAVPAGVSMLDLLGMEAKTR